MNCYSCQIETARDKENYDEHSRIKMNVVEQRIVV